jgi:hypothetical protein
VRIIKPVAVQSRIFSLDAYNKAIEALSATVKATQELINLKNEIIEEKEKRIQEKDTIITIRENQLVQEQRLRLRAESRYNAVLADRNVLEVSAVVYRNLKKSKSLPVSDTIKLIVNEYILEPSQKPLAARPLKAEAKLALASLRDRDVFFAQISDANLSNEMEMAYHNLSSRIHFPDKSSLSAGIYVGSGNLVNRAMIAVFTCIAQKHGLYDETVRLLNTDEAYSCTISNGEFQPP